MKKNSKRIIAGFTSLIICCFIMLILGAMKSPAPKKIRSYLALGDSYTIGEKVIATESFPYQVVQLLEKENVRVQTPTIVAKTGWTTDELQEAINNTKLKRRYDFVTLLIGVNNQYRGRKVVDYIPEFEQLLKQALKFAGNDTAHVMVISIPDWGVTPFAEGRDRAQVAKEIDEYNAANKLLTQKYHLHYIDITGNSRKVPEDPTLVAVDGLHPSGKQYAEWAGLVADYIKRKL